MAVRGLVVPSVSVLERPAPPKTAPPRAPPRLGGRAGPGVSGARRRLGAHAGSRRAAGAGRSPGAARVSVPRGLRRRDRGQGPQQHPVAPPHEEPTEPNRSSLHRRPTPPSAVPTPDSSPALSPPNSASHRWSTHPSQIRHQPTRHARPARCRRPAPGPPAPAWANPHHIYLARRGRGVRREAADPPSSLSPGGKPRKHPTAGRRPVALREETHGAKQMEGNTRRETQGGKQVSRGRSASLTPGAGFAAARPLHSASSTEVRPQRVGRGVDGPVYVVAPGRPRPSD